MDTQTLIKEILQSGLTQIQVAQSVGCSQSYISELMSGKKGGRISYQVRTALDSLHCKVKSAPHPGAGA